MEELKLSFEGNRYTVKDIYDLIKWRDTRSLREEVHDEYSKASRIRGKNVDYSTERRWVIDRLKMMRANVLDSTFETYRKQVSDAIGDIEYPVDDSGIALLIQLGQNIGCGRHMVLVDRFKAEVADEKKVQRR